MMKHVILLVAISFVVAASAYSQSRENVNVIAFGAHPDDAELKASGVASLWSELGARVKMVSMTNGDVGHFEMSGGPLAQRRAAEVGECAEIMGTAVEVLDIHDGELMPTLENRKTVVRLIREWEADIVMSHRRYDYHADHRYTGELVEDAAVVAVAPFYDPLTPAVKRNPIFLHYPDGFQKPYPFQPDFVVSIDEVAQKKWDCIRAMPSQFADSASWQAMYRPNISSDPEERAQQILNGVMAGNAAVADRYRDRLIELYGEEKGRAVKYAEAFEICQYGRQPTIDELKRLFPTFD